MGTMGKGHPPGPIPPAPPRPGSPTETDPGVEVGREFLAEYRERVSGTTFFGVPITKFEKEDLQAIVVFVGEWAMREREENSRGMDFMAAAGRRR